MGDNKISLIPDGAITELTKGVYNDVGHPILKEVGDIGGSIMKFVALPFKFLGLTAEQLESKYKVFLEKTITKVDATTYVLPKAAVIAPLLDHVKYVFDEDGLTEMFSNLLANAMSSNVEKFVHPAFVEMLKQMSPLDVEFMYLYFKSDGIVEIRDLTWSRGNTQKSLTVDSLTRLGIINSISYDDRDDVALQLTDFGTVFRNLCMSKPIDVDLSDFILNQRFQQEDDTQEGDFGFSISDSFTTVRKSEHDNKLYVRERFQKEDVDKGSFICILIRIYNEEMEDFMIDSMYIEHDAKTHIVTDSEVPSVISKSNFKDFLFIATQENNLLECVLKENSKIIMKTDSTVYEFQLSRATMKEISLFNENHKKSN